MNEFYNKMKFFEETEKINREIYYHYTSLNSLYEIIQNKTFWLTGLSSSNDKLELYYKMKSFIDNIDQIIKNEIDKNKKEYFILMKKSLDNNKELFEKSISDSKEPFALSLSIKKDNLTHWDRYAEKCSGVCIGLNVSAMKIYYSRMNCQIFGDSIFDIGKVIYDDNIMTYLNTYIINGFKLIEKMNESSENESFQDTILKQGYMILAIIYLRMKQFIKNSSFVDEDEVRLFFDAVSIKRTIHLIDLMKGNVRDELYNNIRKNFIELVKKLDIQNPYFAMFGTGIRSYRKLCLKEIWGSGIIPEIVLGPMCVQNKMELKKILKQSGLEGTIISVSKVPIR